MAKILGLDLGTNSIGWALINDQTKEIIKTGVRIFPEGVNDINQSKEKSKNADRRIARGIRRNNYRFKMRRERLKKVLLNLGMFPDERYYTFKKKNKENKENKEKIYLTIELYKLRKDALEIPLQLQDLGRIFLHLNNHRGFKSNKKEEADKEFSNKAKDADKINTIQQKQDTLFVLNKRKEKIFKEIEDLKNSQKKDVQGKISNKNKKIKFIEKEIKKVEEKQTLQEKINKALEEGKIKYGTLGEYYYYIIEANNNTYNPNSPNINLGRLRNNDDGEGEYTTREIFEFEFDKIWERQTELNKNNKKVLSVFTDENKRRIKDECIFYQRDLRSQKHLVDKCNYEYAKYFIYKFDNENYQKQIDSLTYSCSTKQEVQLNDEQKKNMNEVISKKKEITIAEIKKIIDIKDEYYKNENSNYKNKTIINNLPENKIIERDYLPCCHKSSLEFQEFRIWEQLNNLRYTDQDDVEHELTLEQKKILANKLHQISELIIEIGNKASPEDKEDVSELKEELGLKKEDKFKEIQKLKGNITLTKLIDALGKEYWDTLNISEKEPEIKIADKTTGEIFTLMKAIQYSDIQKQLYNHIVFAMNFIKSIDWLKGTGKAKKWKESILKIGLNKPQNETQLEAYSKISFEPDYCSYSLKAIKKLLPWMKLGLNESQAAEKVGYESASDERKNEQYLQDNLPELKNNALKNPIVQRGVSETVQLVNDIIKVELNGKKPDKVHLEMARELKKPKKVRQETKRLNDEKEKERKQWAAFLKVDVNNSSILSKFELFLELEQVRTSFEEMRKEINLEDFISFCKTVMGEKNFVLKPDKFNQLKNKLIKKQNEDEPEINNKNTDSNDKEDEGNKTEKANLKLLKTRLWLECNRILPYTGKVVILSRLLSDDSDIEIEHIIPYSRCMDNSFLNKTLSDREFNTKKGKKTPMEYFEVNEKEKKAFIKRVNKIGNEEKKKRFLLEGEDALNKFRNSQLENTAYIAKEVKKHLLNTFKRDAIVMTNGQITSMLRGFLGLNTILNPPLDVECYENGKYWAFVNELYQIDKLEQIQKDEEKPQPEDKKQKVLEGNVSNGRFYPKKQRNDHRHHAIDAIAITLTNDKVTKIIEQNTEGYYMKDGKIIDKYKEDAIWVDKFDEDGQLTRETKDKIKEEIKKELNFNKLWNKAKEATEHLPVSYNNKNRIISTGRKNIHKNRTTYKSGGDIARGALHEASIYGKTKNLKENEYVKRVSVKSLTWSQILNIADSQIKSILIKDVAKYASDKFQEDKLKNAALEEFSLSFKELVKLDMEKISYEEEIKIMDEIGILNDNDNKLKKELSKKHKEVVLKIKLDKEKNKNLKGKKYKDYLIKGFKEAIKKGFFIENTGKRQKKLNISKDEKVERLPVPIKRVRVKYTSTAMRDYKTNIYNNKAFIEPGENYGIALYENDIVNDDEKRSFKSVSFIDAVKIEKENNQIKKENLKRSEKELEQIPLKPLFPQRFQGKQILTFLSKKDMVLVYKEHPHEITDLIGKKEYSDEEKELIFKRLFVVRKSDKNGLIVLSRHNLSGAKNEEDIPVTDLDSLDGKVIRCDYKTFKGKKVIIDRLGNIKPV